MNDNEKEIPLVSIGMPVYNGERYLNDAIESILNQEYQNIELIISDNASSDLTKDICEMYCERDSRIRYYRNDYNLGAVKNIKRVFDLSSGEYFMWAAHDDIREPEFITLCLDELRKYSSAVLCMSDVLTIDSEGKVIKENEVCDALEQDIKQLIINFSKKSVFFETYGLIRRNALNALDLSGEEFGVDAIWLLQLMLQGKVLRVNKFLFKYRYLPKSANDYIDIFYTKADTRNKLRSLPYVQLAKNMCKVVKESDLDKNTKEIVIEEMLIQYTQESEEWKIILRNDCEQSLVSVLYDGEYFSEFLYLLLSTKLSVEEIQNRLKGKTLDLKLQKVINKRPIMLWGTGSGGQTAYNKLTKFGVSIDGFIDSSLIKAGKTYNNLDVYNPEIIMTQKPFIVIASSHWKEIKEMLLQKKYKPDIDFISYF